MKISQRVITTKSLLKEGLLRLLEEDDLPTITITQLCNESGINRTTFYRHYNTPHDVLVDFETDVVRELDLAAPKPRCVQDIKKYLTAVCRYLYDHANIFLILFRNHVDAAFTQYLNSACRKIWTFKNVSCTPDSLPLFLSSLGGREYFLLRCWLLEDIQKSPEEVAELLIAMNYKT